MHETSFIPQHIQNLIMLMDIHKLKLTHMFQFNACQSPMKDQNYGTVKTKITTKGRKKGYHGMIPSLASENLQKRMILYSGLNDY